MLFGHKNKLQVDLGELNDQKPLLQTFLQSNLKTTITDAGTNKLTINSDALPPQELQRIVTKFIYKRNLNTKYYASTKGNTIKITPFKNAKKPEKPNKNPTPPKFAHGF
ncbi:MAG: hypothetical protein NWF04_09045 [Candidatus Bathyarchaeota archaeon]|nr:hypothetical protein [Candidatus Bathyarchaeota archaeon]